MSPDTIRECSFFYFEGNETVNTFGQHYYFDDMNDQIDQLKGVSMNESFIFFWNLGKVWKLELKSKEMT